MLAYIARLTSPPLQTLTTIQPTTSTISFTVSTRPTARTLPAKLLHYLSLLLRILLGIAALGLLYMKWIAHINERPLPERPTIQGNTTTAHITDLRTGLAIASVLLGRMVERLQWRYLIPSSLLTLWAVVRRGYTEESLLILRGLGIQTSTSSPTYLSTPSTRFIPTTSIQDIFIHEAFKGFEVRFYLSIVVEGEEDVVVVFPRLLPCRQILEEVWRGARGGLYERAVGKGLR